MKRAIPPIQLYEFGVWTIRQFLGLLDGLAAIHRMSASDGCQSHMQCRHGDLRPANILVMHASEVSRNHAIGVANCRLQIASMAMAQLFQDESQYTVPSETGTYQGPECHLQVAIGPLYDIWSLGGLFLELIIWYLEGPSGLKAFANKRLAPDPLYGGRVTDDYFFTLGVEDEQYCAAGVRPSVISTIKRLEQDKSMSSTFMAVLNVVKHDMLVPISSQRLGATEISRKLRRLLTLRVDRENTY